MIIYAWVCDWNRCTFLFDEVHHNERLELRKKHGRIECLTENCAGELEPYVQWAAELIKP